MKNIINKNKKNHIKSETGIYTIPCRSCDKNCIGDTSWSIKRCIYEYIQDFKICHNRNVLVKHNSETKHSFNLKGSKMLVNIHYKHRKIVESSIISYYITIKDPLFQLISWLIKVRSY